MVGRGNLKGGDWGPTFKPVDAMHHCPQTRAAVTNDVTVHLTRCEPKTASIRSGLPCAIHSINFANQLSRCFRSMQRDFLTWSKQLRLRSYFGASGYSIC
jgi:hypothetical protein